MIHKLSDLEKWHKKKDPWNYENKTHDFKRKQILMSEIPQKTYNNVLDIGCGQGFITQDLPGDCVFGVDISHQAINFAKEKERDNLKFFQGSIFEIDKFFNVEFDLIVITGVLYKQYIGKSNALIYLLIDKLLSENGVLISVHINEWYYSQFPYLKIKQIYYPYRTYNHTLEIYTK